MKVDPSSKANPASVESNEPLVGLELRSFISSQGMLELVLEQVEAGNLAENEVIVRVEATPLNPSDIGLLFGPADLSEAKKSGTDERPSMTAPVCASSISRLGSRIDKSLKVGNEGAGGHSRRSPGSGFARQDRFNGGWGDVHAISANP